MSTAVEIQEHQILFTTEMVQAILDRRKNQTRRVINPQPIWVSYPNIPFKTPDADPEGMINSPYGKPGDLLYVRETWKPAGWSEDGSNWRIRYKAGGDDIIATHLFEDEQKELDFWIKLSDKLKEAGCPQVDRMYKNVADYLSWKPSIHMPKKASRIWLKVKDIRVEGVQDITDDDAVSEGCESYWWNSAGADVSKTNGVGYKSKVSPRDDFSYLWDAINKKRGFEWEKNPWVWVVLFEVLSTTGKPEIK